MLSIMLIINAYSFAAKCVHARIIYIGKNIWPGLDFYEILISIPIHIPIHFMCNLHSQA